MTRPVAPKQGENAGTSALPQSNGDGSGPSILSNQIACLHVAPEMPAIEGADNNADQSWLDRLMKDSPQDFFGEGKVQMDKTEESE